MASFTPKIAIIGAGPAGLTLARLLYVNNIQVQVFERESAYNSRSQGGSLDLHTDTGLLALEEAGLTSEFNKVARAEGEQTRIGDKTGRVLMDESGGPEGHGRPEIDRRELRFLLLNSLPPGVIHWNTHITSIAVSSSSPSKWAIQVADDAAATEFDLVVGADGAFSATRRLLSKDQIPAYSGISGLELRFVQPAETHPSISAMVGQGSYFVLSDAKVLLCQRNGDGSIRVYAFLRKPETWLAEEGLGADLRDPQAAKTAILKEFADWSANLRDLVLLADGDVRSWKLYFLPVGHRWEHKAGLTLIGDAAHLMTPFAGEGVNVAMSDSLYLARAIVTASKKAAAATGLEEESKVLDEAVRASELEMWPRAGASAKESWDNQELMFSEGDSATTFVEAMKRVMGGDGQGPPGGGH